MNNTSPNSTKPHPKLQTKQLILWTAALIVGAVLGSLGYARLNAFMDFVASAFTRLFQFVAIPTVTLAVLTTLGNLGASSDTGRIFRKTLGYTLLTSFASALVGLGLFLLVRPGNLPTEAVAQGAQVQMVQNLGDKPLTVYQHILSILPNNFVSPFLSGNVLSIVLIAAAIGIAIAFNLQEGKGVRTLLDALCGLQQVLFAIIRGLIKILPLGIIAYAAQLAAQIAQFESTGIADSIGKYVLVVLGGNLLQFFIILPLFCMLRGINGYKVMRAMSPALLMALFTKSSAATLPVTVSTAETNLKARPAVARFILPICCTINMNGCAAFILVTSLFVMQNGGMALSIGQMLLWVVIAVVCAIGNAGVPMGCYFLTLSLMSGIGGPIGILGVILPVYTIIDMIETAENVWSDCCICAVVNKELP